MHANAWDRSQVKDWVTAREDELAKFVGYESRVARPIALIETAQRMGFTDDATASQLLNDLYTLADLCRIGRRNTGLLRNPTPEVEVLFMTGRDA